MRDGLRVPIAVAIICLGAVAGFFVAHLARVARTQAVVDTSPTPPPAAVTEQAHETTAPRPIPTQLPNISLADPAGVKHALSEWKGRPLLINFWATWCAPCRREIPLLKALRKERAADGIEIVGIAVDFRDAVQHYARQMGIDYPVLVGEQDGLDAIAAFGMDTVFPFTVFADARGRIVTLKVGELHADEARFILDRVKGVDSGRLDLVAAKKEIADGIAALAAERARHDDGPEQTQAAPAT
ncbi:MAG: TlpA family protein disulfide reductase [Proteobacteria bacterium]|nr:TlpA family protein disulfide reductase [Pseudomonadota bacterium]